MEYKISGYKIRKFKCCLTCKHSKLLEYWGVECLLMDHELDETPFTPEVSPLGICNFYEKVE